MEIAFLGGSGNFLAAGGAIDVATARSERFENGVEVFNDVILAANHLAVAPLEAPDAAAGANVAIVEALGGELFGAANVVYVVGIAAVDDDIAGIEFAG